MYVVIHNAGSALMRTHSTWFCARTMFSMNEIIQIPDTVSRGNRSYHIKDFYGNKYLIDTDFPTNTRHLSEDSVTSKLLFELNYGTSGCIFDAGAVKTTPDPPFHWIQKDDHAKRNLQPRSLLSDS